MSHSANTAKVTCRGPSSPLAAHPSTSVTPQRIRPNLTLHTIDTTSTEPSSSSHPPEPISPVPTEIATDLPVIELTAKERREGLLVAGIKARDFAYESESVPNACKATEVFDPVPSLIAADWHMRNPHKNYGLIMPKVLFRLIKIGWLTLPEVGRRFGPVEFAMLKEYNDLPDERRYLFVVLVLEHMLTPSQRVRMRRNAGLTIHWDDHPNSSFFGYNPTGTGCSDNEDDAPSLPRMPGRAARVEAPSRSGSKTSAVPVPESGPEPAEPKAKCRKVRGTLTPTRKNPYPERGYGFWSGRGQGSPGVTPGLPVTIPRCDAQIVANRCFSVVTAQRGILPADACEGGLSKFNFLLLSECVCMYVLAPRALS